MYSGGVASRYDMYYGDLAFTLGNAINVSKTAAISFGNVSVNYDLTNELFTNGLQVEGSLPMVWLGKPTSWQAYIEDTYVAGSAVYINHYDEVGATIGTRHGMNTQSWDALRVGASVTVGTGSASGKSHDYEAYKLVLSYRF